MILCKEMEENIIIHCNLCDRDENLNAKSKIFKTLFANKKKKKKIE